MYKLNADMKTIITKVHILVPVITLLTNGGIIYPIHHESPESFSSQHIARPSGKVAAKILEVMAKVNGSVGVIILKEGLEILNNHECIVIRLHEPVKFIEVMIINILESFLCLSPQPLSTLLHLFTLMSNAIKKSRFVFALYSFKGLLAVLSR